MQTKSKFKVGDIVMLKSGGPKMTIYDLNENGGGVITIFRTTWFAGNKNEKGNFPPEALMFAPETDQKTK
jgi:uncharacterized protein YodC (DUF2158 family)